MARGLELDELVEHFTLLPDEVELLGDKAGASRLGFALLLKHFTLVGRFPAGRGELADEAVEFVARQVEVSAAELAFYDWVRPDDQEAPGGGAPGAGVPGVQRRGR